MMTIAKNAPEREEIEEIEALLPWHAAGTLSRRDAARVEEALAKNNELARRFELVREELSETILFNETLGAPSARASEQLFAKIDAEVPVARKSTFSLGAWLTEFVAGFSPRTLAWSAVAAALAIVVQAGVLAGIFIKEQGGSRNFEVASHGQPSAVDEGSFAILRFNPQATAAEIAKFLETNKASIVRGPMAGGMFRVRVAVTALPKDELARIVKRMQEDTKAVGFVAATE